MITHHTDLLVSEAQALASRIASDALRDELDLEGRVKCLGALSSFLRTVRPSETLVSHIYTSTPPQHPVGPGVE